MTITTIDPNLFNVPNPYSTTTTQGTNTNGYSDNSVFTEQNTQQQTTAKATTAPTNDANAKDGKDDGKIGFWAAAGKVLIGAGKSIINTVVDIATDPKKLIATVATVAIGIAFPPVGVAMAVAGGVMGTGKVIGGISKAASATTDAEKEAAFEDIGAGGLQVGLSVVGAKAGIKAMKGTSGSAMAATTKGTKILGKGGKADAFIKDVKTGGRGASTKGTAGYENGGYLGTKAFNTVKTNIADKGLIKGLKKTGTEAIDDVRTKISPEKTKLKAQKKGLEKDLEKAQKKLDELSETDPARAATQKEFDIAKSKVDGFDDTFQKAKTDAKDLLEQQKKIYKERKANVEKLEANNATQAEIDLAKIQVEATKTGYKNAKNDLNTNIIKRTAGATNDAAKTAGYGSVFSASTPATALNMSNPNTGVIPQATTSTAQTPTTPVAMPELLTYQIDADKINRDAMNAQLTGQALTNGSYGSMLNYES